MLVSYLLGFGGVEREVCIFDGLGLVLTLVVLKEFEERVGEEFVNPSVG